MRATFYSKPAHERYSVGEQFPLKLRINTQAIPATTEHVLDFNGDLYVSINKIHCQDWRERQQLRYISQ